MKTPTFQTKRGKVCYSIARFLWWFCLIGYVPVLALVLWIIDLNSPGGFIDFGFWFPFFIVLIVTLPLLLVFAAAGLLIHHKLCTRTEKAELKKTKRGGLFGWLSLVSAALCFLSMVGYLSVWSEINEFLLFVGAPVFGAGAVVFLILMLVKNK